MTAPEERINNTIPMIEEILNNAVKTSNTDEGFIRETLSDTLNSIDNLLNGGNLKLKSRLTLQNVQGVQTAAAINFFLKTKFDFTNEILTVMAIERIETSISEKGKSRDEMIKIVEGLSQGLQEEKSMQTILANMGR